MPLKVAPDSEGELIFQGLCVRHVQTPSQRQVEGFQSRTVLLIDAKVLILDSHSLSEDDRLTRVQFLSVGSDEASIAGGICDPHPTPSRLVDLFPQKLRYLTIGVLLGSYPRFVR